MAKKGDGLLQRAQYFGLSDEVMSGTAVAVPSRRYFDMFIASNIKAMYMKNTQK